MYSEDQLIQAPKTWLEAALADHLRDFPYRVEGEGSDQEKIKFLGGRLTAEGIRSSQQKIKEDRLLILLQERLGRDVQLIRLGDGHLAVPLSVSIKRTMQETAKVLFDEVMIYAVEELDEPVIAIRFPYVKLLNDFVKEEEKKSLNLQLNFSFTHLLNFGYNAILTPTREFSFPQTLETLMLMTSLGLNEYSYPCLDETWKMTFKPGQFRYLKVKHRICPSALQTLEWQQAGMREAKAHYLYLQSKNVANTQKLQLARADLYKLIPVQSLCAHFKKIQQDDTHFYCQHCDKNFETYGAPGQMQVKQVMVPPNTDIKLFWLKMAVDRALAGTSLAYQYTVEEGCIKFQGVQAQYALAVCGGNMNNLEYVLQTRFKSPFRINYILEQQAIRVVFEEARLIGGCNQDFKTDQGMLLLNILSPGEIIICRKRRGAEKHKINVCCYNPEEAQDLRGEIQSLYPVQNKILEEANSSRSIVFSPQYNIEGDLYVGEPNVQFLALIELLGLNHHLDVGPGGGLIELLTFSVKKLSPPIKTRHRALTHYAIRTIRQKEALLALRLQEANTHWMYLELFQNQKKVVIPLAKEKWERNRKALQAEILDYQEKCTHAQKIVEASVPVKIFVCVNCEKKMSVNLANPEVNVQLIVGKEMQGEPQVKVLLTVSPYPPPSINASPIEISAGSPSSLSPASAAAASPYSSSCSYGKTKLVPFAAPRILQGRSEQQLALSSKEENDFL